MKIAVSLPDLDRNPPWVIAMLCSDKLDKSAVVQADKSRVDEFGVVFTCDLITAACICDTLRTKDHNVKRYPTRVYVQKATAWVRVPGGEKLVNVVDDKCVLNPKWFPPAKLPEPELPPFEPTRATGGYVVELK